jgi:hypothetical protein
MPAQFQACGIFPGSCTRPSIFFFEKTWAKQMNMAIALLHTIPVTASAGIDLSPRDCIRLLPMCLFDLFSVGLYSASVSFACSYWIQLAA